MLGHRLHRFDGAMALVAGLRRSVLFDVTLVIEFHVIGKHVDLLPSDRRVVVVGFRKLLDFGAIGRNNQVAIHANVQAGNRRVIRALGRRVAVKTLHLVLTGVELMGERDRLFGRVTLVVSNRTPLARCQRQRHKGP